ncbi:MAG: AI-2E family transporter [Candidatus Doudnabacteria bacterium]|nr:AI-2E family transporter [Candidatus Doudnabacteria bacterium]
MLETTQKVSINVSTASLIKLVIFGLLLVALYLVRDIILTLLIAMVMAAAMDPLVEWLYRKAKFPRGLSVILVYLVFIGFVAMIIYFLIPPMVVQFNQLAQRLGDFRQELDTKTVTLARVLNQLGITQGLSNLGENFAKITGNFFQTTLGVFSGIVQVISVLAISFYLISSESGMKNFVKSLTPFKHKAYAVALTDKIQKKISHWVLGQIILSAFIFVLTFIGLTILGVKYALALSLLAGLLEIIPYLGPILSAIPAIFVAFVQSPPLALFVLILYIVVQQVENYVLVPKIMGRTVGANPVVILLAVLVGFNIAGILGMLLAVPIVAAVSAFLSDFRESASQELKDA